MQTPDDRCDSDNVVSSGIGAHEHVVIVIRDVNLSACVRAVSIIRSVGPARDPGRYPVELPVTRVSYESREGPSRSAILGEDSPLPSFH